MVVRQILCYLSQHPDARDTPDGIFQWWIPKDCPAWGEGEIQEALDALVARGWLMARQTHDKQRLYGLNKEKLPEIKVFLDRPERKAENIDLSSFRGPCPLDS